MTVSNRFLCQERRLVRLKVDTDLQVGVCKIGIECGGVDFYPQERHDAHAHTDERKFWKSSL